MTGSRKQETEIAGRHAGVSPPVRGFRDLIAWQRAMALCRACYQFSNQFPESERFGLVSQLRRAASSVPLNIAEGFGIGTRPAFRKHLRIARGSLCEVSTILELTGQLGLPAAPKELADLADETGRVLHGLLRATAGARRAAPAGASGASVS